MRILIILTAFLLFSCKPAEFRIKDYSYTKEWYFEAGQRYQVYQTKNGTKYIFVLNKRESKFIRKYLKK
jgi:hypothetical protein